MTKAQPTNVWRKLLRAFGPDLWLHWRLLCWAYFFRLLSIGAVIFAPWPLKVIIDHVIPARPLPTALTRFAISLSSEKLALIMVSLFLASTVLGAVTNALEKNFSARVREKLTLHLRDRLLAHLQTMPPTFRTTHKSGELVLRLVDDSDLFVRILTKTLPVLFQQIATVALILVVMLWLDLRLALLASLLVPALLIVIRYYSRRLWVSSRDKRKQEGKVSALAQEIVRGLSAIQALGGESRARLRFELVNRNRLHSGVEETRIAVQMERSLQLIQGVALALTTGVGTILVLRHQLTIGELTVFAAYVGQLLKPIEKLNDLSETMGRGVAGGERLLWLLERDPLTKDAPNARDLDQVRGVIELSDVWFKYPDDEEIRDDFVLRGVNLRLEPGNLSVLIGPSGAGKSTILSLIVRLFDPFSGTVTLDGQSLRDVKLRSLRSQIALMTQDVHIFSGTLRETLVADGVALSEEQIWDGLKQVALDDFVRLLPDQLESRLGEDAVNLSGGQRQRLSLARAILLNRPVLLLDEPLANVDATSARVILEALEQLRVTRTLLTITHQPQLLEYADVVYRIERGSVTVQERELVVPEEELILSEVVA
jgi:ABC-type multidrug transport system fused ATPase/permease subunit